MFGSGLTLASFIKFIHAIFLGKPKDGKRNEVPWTMWLPPVILAALCIIFGVFAYLIPLKYLVVPALSERLEFIGSWPSLRATLYLIIGLGVGLVIYLLGNFKGIRETDPYIGGEEIVKDMRLSGTEFYGTIKELPFLRGIYAKAERKVFDIYDQGKRLVFFFIGIFRYLHNGVLPTYLVWCLLGMLVFFFVIVK